MNVLERIERGELSLYTAVKRLGFVPTATDDIDELLRLAKIGAEAEKASRECQIKMYISYEHECQMDGEICENYKVCKLVREGKE